MITDIFKKNYLLELNTDLQKYIKSFLSYDEIILIYLDQYMFNFIKKRNKRFYINILKCKYLVKNFWDKKFDIEYYFYKADVIDTDKEKQNTKILQYIERCIIIKCLDSYYYCNDNIPKIIEGYRYKQVIEELERIKYFRSITTFKKNEYSKLIDIFNEDDPNIFI